ncbi:unnamed protein product [Cochlearia groenlandica]
MARNAPEASESPARHRQSPRRRSSPRREESSNSRNRSSRSPSPRTKRLKRAQGERELGRSRDREDEKLNGRGREKSSNSREVERDRERRRGGDKDMDDNKRRHSGKEESEERRRGGREDERKGRGRHESKGSLERDTVSMHDQGSNARGGDEEPNDEEDSIARMRATEEALAAKKKEEPSFELSGKLAEETNRYRGITLLFNEPPEARKPNDRWRLYVFKDGEPLNDPLQLHRQSCYLFGRERRIADIPTDHPSCSKQHAVIQFREVEKEKPDGMMGKQVRPYIMDLGSTNKTYINESPMEPQRYYELFEKDTIKFGNSSREYVLLHENSAE